MPWLALVVCKAATERGQRPDPRLSDAAEALGRVKMVERGRPGEPTPDSIRRVRILHAQLRRTFTAEPVALGVRDLDEHGPAMPESGLPAWLCPAIPTGPPDEGELPRWLKEARDAARQRGEEGWLQLSCTHFLPERGAEGRRRRDALAVSPEGRVYRVPARSGEILNTRFELCLVPVRGPRSVRGGAPWRLRAVRRAGGARLPWAAVSDVVAGVAQRGWG